MMSFGWKRKIASPVEMGTASVFQKESEKETIPVPELLSLPKKSHMSNEADKDRANILKEAGSRAAEAGQYVLPQTF